LDKPDDFENNAEDGVVQGVGIHAVNFHNADEEDVDEDVGGVPSEELRKLQRQFVVTSLIKFLRHALVREPVDIGASEATVFSR